MFHVTIRKDDTGDDLLYQEEKTGDVMFRVPKHDEKGVERVERLIAHVVSEGRSLDRSLLSDTQDQLAEYRNLAEELEERENSLEGAIYDLEMRASRAEGEEKENFAESAEILRKRLSEGHPLREGFEDEWESGEIDE